ncbi:MAG: lamin tail domain-containing protein [Clostridiales bacterium]|nr:lamin tail domain-containing protein [Clostridiales bacterium]
MEKVMRDALDSGMRVTDFEAIITYPNTETQTPSHYKFTYKIDGNLIVDEFDNINTDEANADLEEEAVEEQKSSTSDETSSDSPLEITRLSLSKEEIDITNKGAESVNLSGYTIVSVTGNQTFTFQSYVLEPNQTVTVYARGGEGDIKWSGSYIWNNDGDPAELYDNVGNLIYTYN